MTAAARYDLGNIEAEARDQNGWAVIAVVRLHDGGNGYVPHGVVMIKRPHHPEERAYATVGYAIRVGEQRRVIFEQGHYDLTRSDALADLRERANGRMTL